MDIREIEQASIKMNITNEILNDLPNWFGLPDYIKEYVDKSSKMPFWAMYNRDNAIGFISLKQNNKYTAEIYVMGIKELYHRHGIGKALFQKCYDYCKVNNIEFLQVKTVDESSADTSYAKTREFYKAMGFRPLECFNELWDASNPCLIMIMHI